MGGLFGLALIGAASVGIFVLPIPAAATILLRRHPASRAIWPAAICGAELPLFFVAYDNRHEPGMVWTWLFVAGALLCLGINLRFRRRQFVLRRWR